MKAKKVIALVMCAAMVAGMSASSVMAADMPEQFKDLKANEAYDFPMMVKSFQSTYWDAAQEGMKKAAEELGVDRTRLARIELGSVIPYPEEVLLMADIYRAPELKGNYCREMCPLGKGMPKIENQDIDRIALRALCSFRKINEAKELLLDITADGVITEDEKPDLEKIIATLDEVNEVTQNLKNWIEKSLK